MIWVLFREGVAILDDRLRPLLAERGERSQRLPIRGVGVDLVREVVVTRRTRGLGVADVQRVQDQPDDEVEQEAPEQRDEDGSLRTRPNLGQPPAGHGADFGCLFACHLWKFSRSSCSLLNDGLGLSMSSINPPAGTVWLRSAKFPHAMLSTYGLLIASL